MNGAGSRTHRPGLQRVRCFNATMAAAQVVDIYRLALEKSRSAGEPGAE